MKAHELATITQQAITKRNNERPAQLYKELMASMESIAKTGYDHIDFLFSDPPEVIAEVLDCLRKDGYSLGKLEKGVVRITWGKNVQCEFDIAWVGRCKEPAGKTGFCVEHTSRRCTCGRQAVRECEATIGAFVCGHLTCGKCRHQH
jgi:hypothetical protein